jgi:hypothetical protein
VIVAVVLLACTTLSVVVGATSPVESDPDALDHAFFALRHTFTR